MTEVNGKQYRPCPFCGSSKLVPTDWWDDDGEYDAIECASCKGCAPADVWNRRVPVLVKESA